MRITSIPHIYRNVKRWTEILSVLSKYGLADWISRLNIDFVKDRLKDRDGEALARHTPEKRIRLALTELGPTFIKLGQLLSTRPDLAGVQLADELKQLQADVPADPPDLVCSLVEEELGQPVAELFAEFNDTPIASASIGQVHAARLVTGEEVVVKVQHAGIEETVPRGLGRADGIGPVGRASSRTGHLSPLGDGRRNGPRLAAGIGFWPRGTEPPAVLRTLQGRSDGPHSATVHRILHRPRADHGAGGRHQARRNESGCWPRGSTWKKSPAAGLGCTST